MVSRLRLVTRDGITCMSRHDREGWDEGFWHQRRKVLTKDTRLRYIRVLALAMNAGDER